jgi:DNA-binding NtrC family response regulator
MKVLIVEDDVATRTGLEQLLAELGAEARAVATVEEARQGLQEYGPDLCLTDLVLPDGDGIEVIRAARASSPAREVVVLTGHGTVKSAVEAMKAGAFDFLLKPLKPAHLVTLLKHLDHKSPGTRQAAALGQEQEVTETGRLGSLVGESAAMREVFRLLARVARSNAPVMITGESGTGKEAAAATIHELSRRSDRPLVAVNCGAVSATLMESELFGHEKGAFTGADKRRAGYFELANGGTLFLDEVTEMATELQVKFLRVLETRTFRRVGGSEELDVDVRIISSSNRNLEDAVRAEKLRGDLYYRLNVFPVWMPPLRERKDDIARLAQHFLEKIEEQERAGMGGIDPAAIQVLQGFDWQGNVRELRNVIHRAYVLSDPPLIRCESIHQGLATLPLERPESAEGGNDETSIRVRVGQSLEEVERQFLKKTLEVVKGNKRKAAELLHISLKTIYNKVKQYGLDQ